MIVQESRQEADVEWVGMAAIKDRVKNLKALLHHGSVTEQQAFLRAFIDRIEIQGSHVAVEYVNP